jgi:hypothetical protein
MVYNTQDYCVLFLDFSIIRSCVQVSRKPDDVKVQKKKTSNPVCYVFVFCVSQTAAFLVELHRQQLFYLNCAMSRM